MALERHDDHEWVQRVKKLGLKALDSYIPEPERAIDSHS